MADELTFHAERTKWALRLLGCIVFVVIGYFIRAEAPLIGWGGMTFFGLLIPVHLIGLASPTSMYLRLDAEGFEIGSFFRKKRTKWTDVQGFELDSIGGFIVGGAKVIRVNTLTYTDMGDTISNYNAPLTEILDTLNQWRGRYGSG